MTAAPDPRLGHNGGPPLEEPSSEARGRCRDCRHWHAPPETEQRAYEWFRLGLSRRRVRRPTGACDRVVLSAGRAPAFSATTAEFGCINFEAKPPPSAAERRRVRHDLRGRPRGLAGTGGGRARPVQPAGAGSVRRRRSVEAAFRLRALPDLRLRRGSSRGRGLRRLRDGLGGRERGSRPARHGD